MPRGIAALVRFGLLSLLAGLAACGAGASEGGAADFPAEVRETLRLIERGGPFPYARDGVVFGNYERRLPKRPRGYYHEYTVKTPDSHDRGARRIVCGPPPECYYTDDHYRTFKRIGP